MQPSKQQTNIIVHSINLVQVKLYLIKSLLNNINN